MYKDQMTPVERAQAIAEGKDVDRMPIGIMFGAPAHSLLGWTVQQEWESGRSLAEVQKKVYQTLHTDGMGAGHGLHGLGSVSYTHLDVYKRQILRNTSGNIWTQFPIQ